MNNLIAIVDNAGNPWALCPSEEIAKDLVSNQYDPSYFQIKEVSIPNFMSGTKSGKSGAMSPLL